MIRIVWIVLAAAPVFAQDAARGEKIFAANCSVPYCHGPNGTAGRAPRLAGHSFTAGELRDTVSNGIADRGMPPFASQLSSADLDALVGYLMTLSGTAPAPVNNARAREPESPGKTLFFDAVRMGGCGRCHELERRGSPVAPPIKNVPADLRSVAATHVATVSANGDAFPAIVIEKSATRVRAYDLSSTLPVLRTFAAGAQVTETSHWSHRDAIAGYSDADLRQIAAYLQSIVAK